MQKIIIPILIMIISLTSCVNEEKLDSTPNSGWIEVDGDTFADTVNFDNGTYDIPLKLSSATNTNGIEVTYKVELVSGSIDNQSVLGNKTVMMEANSDVAIIHFEPVASSYYYTLKFTLIRTDDAEFKVGLSDGSKPVDFTLSVTNFVNYNGDVSAFGDTPPSYVTQVGREDATHFVVNSLWGPNFVAWTQGNNPAFFDRFYNAGVITLNPSDNTLSVAGDYVDAAGSSGTYNPTTGVLDYTFIQADLFSTGFSVSTTLTPQ